MPEQTRPSPQHEEWPLVKYLPYTHSRYLSTNNWVSKTIKTGSNSVKSMAATSKVGLKSGDGEAPTAGQLSCSRKGSKSKVVGHKSIGSTPRFPPQIFKKMGGGEVNTTTRCTIRKPAHFSQQESSIPIHLLGSSGLVDCGKVAPISVQQKRIKV